ncbi:MAG: EAL domain-containing protein [Erysipelotrichaceae bacterium]|nr:EAL domain-containing protein [Erysipelotrichaceae bacterium]
MICAFFAFKTKKAIGKSVFHLCAALIFPVAGNLMIIASGNEMVSTIGAYIYYLGMDLTMSALMKFTHDYCGVDKRYNSLRLNTNIIIAMDAIQLLMNPFFHHAFSLTPIDVDGFPYYKLVPYTGQSIHRVVDYTVFLSVLIIFLFKFFRSPRISSERYSVILLTMCFVGLWSTFYIFAGTPIDTSMVGYAIFGIMVFYFALYYRPMRLLDRMLAGVASQMPEALYFFDGTGRCIWANRQGAKFMNVRNESYDSVTDQLIRVFDDIGEDEDRWSSRKTIGVGETTKYYVLERQSLNDVHNKVAGSFLSIRDVTKEEKALRVEKYNATHDNLTDLYTKEYLYECTARMIGEHPEENFLIAFINVTDFKIINDIYGSDFGDFVLKKIASYIMETMPEDSVYGRMGGDKFGICIAEREFDEVKIEKSLSDFVVSDGVNRHNILLHMGVYEVSEPDLDPSIMYDRAHMALSVIKNEYQRRISYYDDKMRDSVIWSQRLSSQLEDAIALKQVVPYIQPILNTEGKIVGGEALVRWIHPEYGFLAPDMFVPVFEKNGMIAELDRYMWRCACEIMARWKKEGKDLFISINISPKDFYFMNVNEEIIKITSAYDIEPRKLRIEITETIMMTDVNSRLKNLMKLRDDGFIVEMDDFGSGYSSLNLLKDMPVDVLKIDMAFLKQSKENIKTQKILHNIIKMSDDLGIVPLTEGVETIEQYRMLSEMGCKLFQGYYFSKPLPLEEFEKYAYDNLLNN